MEGPITLTILSCRDCRHFHSLVGGKIGAASYQTVGVCKHPEVIRVTSPSFAFKAWDTGEYVPFVMLDRRGDYATPSDACPFLPAKSD